MEDGVSTASWSLATRALPLEEHEEIVVTYGTKAEHPKPIPSSYPLPARL